MRNAECGMRNFLICSTAMAPLDQKILILHSKQGSFPRLLRIKKFRIPYSALRIQKFRTPHSLIDPHFPLPRFCPAAVHAFGVERLGDIAVFINGD